MTEQFLGLSPPAWLAMISATSLTVIATGVLVAIRSLLINTRALRAQALKSFSDDLVKTSDARLYVLQNLPLKECYDDLDAESEKKARQVINALNQIAIMVEQQFLPVEAVFSLCHTVVIRCWYKLEKYAHYYERKTGGRYGRRVKSLVDRAKTFHDARPHQRVHPILLYDQSGTVYEVYKTRRKSGFAGLFQWIGWWFRFRLSIY